MPFLLPPDPRLIAMAGDWHGNLAFALGQVARARDAGCEVIVQCGDFGYWRPDPTTRKYLFRLERTLSAAGMWLLWVDGNHEDHDLLNSRPVDPTSGARPISDHIAHLPRGHRWTWGGYTWLALGGAVSMDQDQRKPGVDWWAGESLTPADLERAVAGGPADVMVCHDAPAGPVIPESGEIQPSSEVLAQAERHRESIRTVVDATRPAALWHGHFHVRRTATIPLPPPSDLPDGAAAAIEVERHLRDSCVVNGLAHDLADPTDNIAWAEPSGAVVSPPSR